MRGEEENKDTLTKPRPWNLRLSPGRPSDALSLSASFDATDFLVHPEDTSGVKKTTKTSLKYFPFVEHSNYK